MKFTITELRKFIRKELKTIDEASWMSKLFGGSEPEVAPTLDDVLKDMVLARWQGLGKKMLQDPAVQAKLSELAREKEQNLNPSDLSVLDKYALDSALLKIKAEWLQGLSGR